MRAKFNIVRTLSTAFRSREWGRGAIGIGTSCAGSKPNEIRNAQNACATPPPSTQSARQSGRAARRSDRARFPVISSAREQSRAVISEHLPRLFKNPRSARRDHFLMILARNRIEFDAVAVGLNASPPAPKVRPLASLAPLKVSLAGPLRGRVAATGIAVVIVAASLALTAAPASALSKHVFSESIAGSGTNALSEPNDVAVDESTGDLYVSDLADHRVEKFSPAGVFILMFGKEVNKTKTEEAGQPGNPHAITEAEENLCTAEQEATEHDECQPATPGRTPGAFEGNNDNFKFDNSRLYLALDNSCSLHRNALGEPEPLTESTTPRCSEFDPSAGDLYVGDPGDALVSKFDPEGHLITGWGQAGQLDGSTARDGPFSRSSLDPNASYFEGIAVDPTDGRLIVASGIEDIYEFNPDAEGSFFATAEGFLYGEEEHPDNGIVAAAEEVYQDGRANLIQLSPGQLVTDSYYQRTGVPFGLEPAIDPATRELYSAGSHYSAPCTTTSEGCAPIEEFGAGHLSDPQGDAIDSQTGTVYVADPGNHSVAVFAAVPYLPTATPAAPTEIASNAAKLSGEVDPAGAGEVKGCKVEYVPADDVQTITVSAATGGTFVLGFPIQQGTTVRSTQPLPFDARPEALERELDQALGQRLIRGAVNVSGPDGGPFRVEFIAALAGDPELPKLIANPSGLTGAGPHLTVSDEPAAHWATAATAPCSETQFPTKRQISADATGLTYGTAYDFRLQARNAEPTPDTSYAETFTTRPLKPTLGTESAGPVFAETAQIHAEIDPGGGESAYHTSYSVEYLTSAQFELNEEEGEPEFAHAQLSPSLDAGSSPAAQRLTAPLDKLQPDTTYHYRLLASNECEEGVRCEVHGEPHTFTTLPLSIGPNDPCPNAHVRQQTSAAQLLDCRAYELVSAPHTAGYDVESNLIEGQQPFAGYPEAKTPSGEPKVLYGIHDGGIPGIGEPTNRGTEPYIATRTPEGWSTEYVGLPAAGIPSAAPFGSPLLEAGPGLNTLAFGGAGLCSPCFSAGQEIGIPLHLAGKESLAQGMAGPLEESTAAKPDGYIARYFSADGTHFVFGSTSRFAEGGNEEAEEEISIYDRNLSTGATHVVSDKPGGGPLECIQGAKKCHSSEHASKNNPNGIAELGISSDGSHILLAQKVTEDADHNVYWHLYMNVGDSGETIDLTPGVIEKFAGTGFKEGVLFDGMSANGSRVFFTTADKLTAEETDPSPHIYEAEINSEGTAASLRLLPTGSEDPGTCDPVANKDGPHWNAVGSAENCGAVALGAGAGVPASGGSIYFLSPELLEAGHGTENQPNLYLDAPGSAPRFIATLEPDNPLVLHSVSAAATRHTADFQLTPTGEYAAFTSALALAGNGEETGEPPHTEVYRYDAAASKLACASCTFSGLPSEADSSLAANGLSLTADGRLFFDSAAALVASDTDERPDVYEWEPKGTGNCEEAAPSYSKATEACRALISAGTSASDSGLLSTDQNGTDVYFFTRDSLAPQDENGPVVKVYDARAGGGFPYVPPRTDCKASDECHGASSPPPPPLQVGSESSTPGIGNHEEQPKCKKGLVLKRGKCVKPHSKKHHPHHRAANRKRGGKK